MSPVGHVLVSWGVLVDLGFSLDTGEGPLKITFKKLGVSLPHNLIVGEEKENFHLGSVLAASISARRPDPSKAKFIKESNAALKGLPHRTRSLRIRSLLRKHKGTKTFFFSYILSLLSSLPSRRVPPIFCQPS